MEERELKKYEGKRVVLMACSKCNIVCKHCYISYTGNRTPEELEDLAKHYMQQDKIVRIDGAEPLVDLGYLKTYKTVGQYWIMTNGFRIYNEPEVIDYIKENGITHIYMSYHFGIQNNINGITNDMLNLNIKRIRENGLNAVLMTTITNQNAKDTLKICDTAYELGAAAIEFNKLFIQGRAKDLISAKLHREDYDEFFKQFAIAKEKYNGKLELTRSGTFGCDTYDKTNIFRCNAGVKKVYITPDDKVYACSCICKTGYEIGKVIDGEIYLYADFQNDRTFCLGDKLGEFGIEDIRELNNPKIRSLIRKN